MKIFLEHKQSISTIYYRVIAVDMSKTDFGGVFEGTISFFPSLKRPHGSHFKPLISLSRARAHTQYEWYSGLDFGYLFCDSLRSIYRRREEKEEVRVDRLKEWKPSKRNCGMNWNLEMGDRCCFVSVMFFSIGIGNEFQVPLFFCLLELAVLFPWASSISRIGGYILYYLFMILL